MKPIHLILSIALAGMLLTLSSCLNSISGTGEATLATRNIENFSGIELDIDAELVLTDSIEQSFMISAQENLMPVIDARVKAGRLIISSDKNILHSKPIIIYISVNRLNRLVLNGSGSVRSTGTLKAGTMDVEVNGSGNVELDVVCDQLNAEISGSGNLKLSGNSNSGKMDISGSGDMDAFNHRTGNCSVSVSGSGKALVFVTGELNASVSGSGTVLYKGNPTNVVPAVSGSGSIEKSE